MFIAKIKITIRKTILDPQGKTIEHSLNSLGFKELKNVRMGKYIELTIDTNSEELAKKIIDEACIKLLSNPIMEDYEFELIKINQ